MAQLIQNIPTHLFLGFLGVGKTSLILNCFKHKPAHEKWAVVVNEFGKLGIDGKIYQSQGISVKEVPGGCLCCAVGLPFERAIIDIIKSQRPDRLFIESSGASHAQGVVKTMRSSSFAGILELKPFVCIIDPQHFTNERYFNNINYQEQLNAADILIANKIDLASETALSSFKQWADKNQARLLNVYQTTQGVINLEWLEASGFSEPHKNVVHHIHAPKRVNNKNTFNTLDWQFSADVILSHEAVQQWLQNTQFIRAKAIINTDQGWFIFNAVDGRLNEEEISASGKTVVEVILPRKNKHLSHHLNETLKKCCINSQSTTDLI